MSLAAFVESHREAITRAVLETYHPLYDANARASRELDSLGLLRQPLGGQSDAIKAAALSIRQQRGTSVVGEMGTGKTTIGIVAARLAGCQTILVVCPPHLVRKWEREVHLTLPEARTTIVRRIQDLERLRETPERPLYVILSREQAKLGYRWRPAYTRRLLVTADGTVERGDDGQPKRLLACPECAERLVDAEGNPLGEGDLGRRKLRCQATRMERSSQGILVKRVCKAPLWTADNGGSLGYAGWERALASNALGSGGRTGGTHRYPLADYIRDRLPDFFDLLIIDEVQEAKGRGSAQGLAAGLLAETCRRTLTLTGTLFGGYSSTLFYLLWRFSPDLRSEFGYGEEGRWVSRYGIVERITRKSPDDDEPYESGTRSKRRSYQTRIVERPGLTPPALLHLIGNTVFLRLTDVASHLPPYREQVVVLPLDDTPLQAKATSVRSALAAESAEVSSETSSLVSQSVAYQRLASSLKAAVSEALARGSKRLLGAYLQSLLAYPDSCTREEVVVDPHGGLVIGQAPALPSDRLYPKERALLDLALRERDRGRRVLVYVTHTESRDLTVRLREVLGRAGLRVGVLKADTVSPEAREGWVAERVKAGLDVLLCHPRLVQTGLDLIDFPSIVWHEVDYSVYTLRQASRRSWRIGQREPVEVTYLVYAGTLQAMALGLVAGKLRSSLLVEGELPEDGLAGFGGDGDDLFLELARRLAAGMGGDSGAGLEVALAQARASAVEAEGFLGMEPEPVALPAQPVPVTPLTPVPSQPASLRVMTFEELRELVAAQAPSSRPTRRRSVRQEAASEAQLSLF